MDDQAVKPVAHVISCRPPCCDHDSRRSHPRGVPNCSLFKDRWGKTIPACPRALSPSTRGTIVPTSPTMSTALFWQSGQKPRSLGRPRFRPDRRWQVIAHELVCVRSPGRSRIVTPAPDGPRPPLSAAEWPRSNRLPSHEPRRAPHDIIRTDQTPTFSARSRAPPPHESLGVPRDVSNSRPVRVPACPLPDPRPALFLQRL